MFTKSNLIKRITNTNGTETKVSLLNDSCQLACKTSNLYRTGFPFCQNLTKDSTNVFTSVENLNNTFNTLTFSLGSQFLKTCKSKFQINNSNNEKIVSNAPTATILNSSNNLNIQLVGQIYKVGRKIGNGNFGELRLGRNITTNKNVAIKFEKSNTRTPLLQIENKFYKRLQNAEGKIA